MSYLLADLSVNLADVIESSAPNFFFAFIVAFILALNVDDSTLQLSILVL